MFPKSTFELIIDEEISYFSNIWDYKMSGIKGDIIIDDSPEGRIRSKERLELEWEEDFENLTTNYDDHIWISIKEVYIKRDSDALNKMEKLEKMCADYVYRKKRNDEKIKKASERLRKVNKRKKEVLSEIQYEYNVNYRIKVDAMILYAISAKHLMHGYMLHHRFNDFKTGLYLASLTFSLLHSFHSAGVFSRLICRQYD